MPLHRCDVPTMPDKLDDFANVGNDKTVGTCRVLNCNDPNTDCTNSKCVCKSGYYAGEGGDKCVKYPDGFMAREL